MGRRAGGGIELIGVALVGLFYAVKFLLPYVVAGFLLYLGFIIIKELYKHIRSEKIRSLLNKAIFIKKLSNEASQSQAKTEIVAKTELTPKHFDSNREITDSSTLAKDIRDFGVSEHQLNEIRKIQKSNLRGRLFEEWAIFFFQHHGFKASTSRSYAKLHGIKIEGYDQGVDIIVQTQNAETIAVQCKHKTKGKIGNHDVREISTGKSVYKCQKGILFTNSSHVTAAARQLASNHDVQILDYVELKKKLRA